MSIYNDTQRSSRPGLIKPLFENFPSELKEIPRWVNWRLKLRNGKWTKPPYQPTNQLAKTDCPETWHSFEDCRSVADRFDGVGFVLSDEDDIVGIDLDKCYCPAFSLTDPSAEEIISEMQTYTEKSPSGRGFRLLCKGKLPEGTRKKGQIEMYDSGRYLTITGHTLNGYRIEDRHEQVLELHSKVFGRSNRNKTPRQRENPSRNHVKDRLRKAFASKNGDVIERLYHGDCSNYPSHSEADLALCSHLAYWFKGDITSMDQAFRESGLYRHKWDEQHSSNGRTYGEITIEKAIASFEDTRGASVGTPHQTSPYFIDQQGFWCRWKHTNNGMIPIRMANFTAEIAEEVIEDDGVALVHRYVLRGRAENKELLEIDVPASSFAGMNWLHRWGTSVIIEPGQSTRDYVRHAIQVGSTTIKKSTRYTHTGWRKIDEEWVFLTAGGSIGREGVSVQLSPEMSRYSLPVNPKNEEEAIRASLSFLDIGKREVTLPLFVFTYLAPLTSLLDPPPNFSNYVFGPTGALKTTMSMLQLSHFGNFPNISHLPNFDDTANSLEKRGFTLKDVLTVLDDYHPSQSRGDAMNKAKLVQRIIRAYSNRTGRGRLNADTTDKGRYSPRGLLQITGEEIASLQSTLARVFVVEIQPGDIDVDKLSKLQQQVHLLPHAMTSFILWVHKHVERILEGFHVRFRELRLQSTKGGSHKKLPEQVAFLRFALEAVIAWMLEKGVLSDDEAKKLAEEAYEVFSLLSERHNRRIEEDDPVTMFEDIINSLLTQGKIRIERRSLSEKALGGSEGVLLGYYDDKALYMIPSAMWHELNRYCIAEGTHFPFRKQTFYKMLRDRKLIEPGSGGDNTTTVKIHGKTERVLKFIGGGIFKNAVTPVTADTED